jgi:hypothetical protein
MRSSDDSTESPIPRDSTRSAPECPVCNNHEGISIVASHTCKFFCAIEDPAGTMSLLFPPPPAAGASGAVDPWPARIYFKDGRFVDETGIPTCAWAIDEAQSCDIEYIRSRAASLGIDLGAELRRFKDWAGTSDGNCSRHDLRENRAGSHEREVDGEMFISNLVERDWQVWQAAVEWRAGQPVSTSKG